MICKESENDIFHFPWSKKLRVTSRGTSRRGSRFSQKPGTTCPLLFPNQNLRIYVTRSLCVPGRWIRPADFYRPLRMWYPDRPRKIPHRSVFQLRKRHRFPTICFESLSVSETMVSGGTSSSPLSSRRPSSSRYARLKCFLNDGV